DDRDNSELVTARYQPAQHSRAAAPHPETARSSWPPIVAGDGGDASRCAGRWARDLLALAEMFTHCSEHGPEHLRRQHAGVGVVAGAVIAREQGEAADFRRAAMAEGSGRAPGPKRLH